MTTKNYSYETARGSRMVRTWVQHDDDGLNPTYMSSVWVNCFPGESGDICSRSRNHQTKAGATRWAKKILDEMEAA
jgi:hypothetical protein